MKKKLALIALSIFLVGSLAKKAKTGGVVYTGKMVNENALAYNKTYTLDLNNINNSSFSVPFSTNSLHVNSMAFQTVISSNIYASATFTDGTVSTGSFTIASLSGLTTAYATDTLTAPSASSLAPVAATDSLNVVSTTNLNNAYFTFNGVSYFAGRDWFVSNASNTAISVCSVMQGFTNVVQATVTLGQTVCYATATTAGAAGNGFTLTSSTPSALTAGSANFLGGRDDVLENAILTINGTAFRNGFLWNEYGPNGVTVTSTGTASSWVALINTLPGLSAQAISSLVTSTATTPGAAGNLNTFAVSTVAVTVGSPNFTGGVDNASITINGKPFRANTEWVPALTATGTAVNLATAINVASNTINVQAQANGTLVTTTSTVTGTAANYAMKSSTASITASAANMVGGTNSAINTTAKSINIPSSNYGTGLALLYTKSAGTSPANLVANTTYYWIAVDTNDGQLAISTTNAIAGTAISISTQLATGGGSFSFAPLAFSGTPGLFWQGSNDNANWSNLSVSSVTFSSPYALSNTLLDFGTINYRYLRANVVGPTQGAISIVVTGNGKD